MAVNFVCCSIFIVFTIFTFVMPTYSQMQETAIRLSLKEALIMGIERNFDVKGVSLKIPVTKEKLNAADARFDAIFKASVSNNSFKEPATSAFSSKDFDVSRKTRGTMGIEKKFKFGLQTNFSYETNRLVNNSAIDSLKPQYNNLLILDLTQPLLRDFGKKINTKNIRILKKNLRQAALTYIDKTYKICKKIELLYYNLAKVIKIYDHRIHSLKLAKELLKNNQKKFEAGVIPITEVLETKTAFSSRQEQLIAAKQKAEYFSNLVKDILEICDDNNPLYKKTILTDPVKQVKDVFPNYDTALSQALKKRPEIQEMLLEVEKKNINIKYYANQKLPKLDLNATIGVNGLSGNNRAVSLSGFTSGLNPFEGNYTDSFSSMAEADGYQWELGAQFSYPIGNKAALAKKNRAGYEKRITVYNLNRLKGKIATEVKNAVVEAMRSLERVNISRNFVKLSEILLEQEMDRLKKGLSDSFRVLKYQDDLIEARIRKLTAITDFNVGLSRLYHGMGKGLERYDIKPIINDKEIKFDE